MCKLSLWFLMSLHIHIHSFTPFIHSFIRRPAKWLFVDWNLPSISTLFLRWKMAIRILFAAISGCFVFLSCRILYALPCVNIVFKVVIPLSVNASNWCHILKWHWVRFFFKYCGLPQSLFQLFSILVLHLPTTKTIILVIDCILQ